VADGNSSPPVAMELPLVMDDAAIVIPVHDMEFADTDDTEVRDTGANQSELDNTTKNDFVISDDVPDNPIPSQMCDSSGCMLCPCNQLNQSLNACDETSRTFRSMHVEERRPIQGDVLNDLSLQPNLIKQLMIDAAISEVNHISGNHVRFGLGSMHSCLEMIDDFMINDKSKGDGNESLSSCEALSFDSSYHGLSVDNPVIGKVASCLFSLNT
jgi:hypothetical protein